MQSIVAALVHSSNDDVNTTVSDRDLRTALHLACAMGNLALAQTLIWVRIILVLRIFLAISMTFQNT